MFHSAYSDRASVIKTGENSIICFRCITIIAVVQNSLVAIIPTSSGGGCWGFTTVPVTKTIRLSDWVTPGDTAIPGMTSLKDGDLQHSSALAQSPKEI